MTFVKEFQDGYGMCRSCGECVCALLIVEDCNGSEFLEFQDEDSLPFQCPNCGEENAEWIPCLEQPKYSELDDHDLPNFHQED